MNLLLEASFSAKNLSKAADLMARSISRRLGQKFHRYGQQDFVKMSTGAGRGILYFVGSTDSAFRLNYEKRRAGKSAALTSIDYWIQWAPDRRPTYTAVLPVGMSSPILVRAIAQFMKSPGTGGHSLSELVTENANTYEKVGLEKFRSEFVRKTGKTEATRDELKAFRAETGWSIPSIIYATKGSRRGLYKLPDSDKFEINRGEQESVSAPPGADKAQKTLDRVPVDVLFKDLEDMVSIVVDGHRPSLLVTGGAGTGKTWTVQQVIKAKGLSQGDDWVMVKGKTSPYGVYRTLYTHRKKLIVFDDSDDVFAGADTRNLLKAALDSYGVRTVSWNSKMTVDVSQMDAEARQAVYDRVDDEMMSGDDNVKLPSEFDFQGRVIFISNIPKEKMEQAIVSRSLTIDVTLKPSEIFDRIEQVIDKINPSDARMDISEKREVLDHLREVAAADPNKYLSMRDFVGALMIKASGTPRWQHLMRYS